MTDGTPDAEEENRCNISKKEGGEIGDLNGWAISKHEEDEDKSIYPQQRQDVSWRNEESLLTRIEESVGPRILKTDGEFPAG